MTPNRPQALSTKTDNGLPIWPRARTIDGYAYELESTHADEAAARRRVEEIREAGDAAQAFTSGRPKFSPAGQKGGEETYFAHAAAVYRVPAGKIGRIEGDGVAWSERPPRVVPDKKAAKKAAKQAKKAEKEAPLKERIKARAKPRQAAPAEQPVTA